MKNPDLSRFYAPDISSDGTYLLPPEESRHAVRVLRLAEGDLLELVDGRGTLFSCRIAGSTKKGTLLEVLDTHFTPHRSHYRLHLAIAPTKSIDRLEWLLEKATEIGMDECTPLICQRSERRDLNHDRMEKILAASMKQSLGLWLPVLHPLTPFKQFTAQPFAGLSAIAHCLDQEKVSLRELVPAVLVPEFRILIGPEGDFTEAEITIALAAGFTPLSLGNTRLRTETAGLVACTELSMLMR